MKKRAIIFVATAVLLIVAGIVFLPPLFRAPQGNNPENALAPGEYYTCPMHPNVRSDHPGNCPICGMKLVKVTREPETMNMAGPGLGEVKLSPSQQVMANVSTSAAMRMRLTKEITALGTFEAAEPNIRQVSARFSGRIEHLYVTFVGQSVRKGEAVADVYSPDAISAQEEFLLALSATSPEASDLLAKAREKLILWGFTENQILDLRNTRKVSDVVKIFSPVSGTVTARKVEPQRYVSMGDELFEVMDLSSVWLDIQAYEYETHDLKTGEEVTAASDALPSKSFKGRISFISPEIDPASRTVLVRAVFPNPAGELKPGMYVNATVSVPLEETVVVPSSAVVSTGKSQVVWVEKEEGVFDPREVTVGERAEGFCQILNGLEAGESVATSGGYLLDSESQLRMPAGMSHPL